MTIYLGLRKKVCRKLGKLIAKSLFGAASNNGQARLKIFIGDKYQAGWEESAMADHIARVLSGERDTEL